MILKFLIKYEYEYTTVPKYLLVNFFSKNISAKSKMVAIDAILKCIRY